MSERGEEALVVLARARMRRALGELDYRRAVADAVAAGLSVSQIGARLGISEEALEGVLARLGGAGQVPQGFSGASPLEICQRHAVGWLSEAEAVEQLSAWPYERVSRGAVGAAVGPAAATGSPAQAGQESVMGQGWEEVGMAVDGGLLSMEAYERVMVAVDPQMAWALRAG